MAFLAAMHGDAFACSACFGASTPLALRAFYVSTILLSAMPFAIIAGFVIYLRRHRLGTGVSSRT